MLTTQEAQTASGAARSEPDAHDALIGTVLLSKLRVVRRIGAGGAGVVYEVEHLITKHRRALKTLRATARESPVQISRFLREAGIAGRLKSPRIVETFDAGRLADGTPYVLMELLDGRSLGAVLREDGPIEPARLVRFAIEVCDALEAAHAAGVVHRDIKPENIFLVEARAKTSEGASAEGAASEHVKVLDFGVCKALDPSFDEIATLTGEGTSVGTPYFMAPEQIEGSDAVDARTDVYALGVTLYQLASGELPFTAASAAALAVKIERGTHRSLDVIARSVSPRFARAIEKSMARLPADRFESVAALRAELQEIARAPTSDGAIDSVVAKPVLTEELAETSTALVRDAGRGRLRARSIAGIAGGIALVVGAAVVFAPRLFTTKPGDGASGAPEITSEAVSAEAAASEPPRRSGTGEPPRASAAEPSATPTADATSGPVEPAGLALSDSSTPASLAGTGKPRRSGTAAPVGSPATSPTLPSTSGVPAPKASASATATTPAPRGSNPYENSPR